MPRGRLHNPDQFRRPRWRSCQFGGFTGTDRPLLSSGAERFSKGRAMAEQQEWTAEEWREYRFLEIVVTERFERAQKGNP